MGQISPSFMTFKVCRLYLGVLGQPESKWKLFEKFLLVKKIEPVQKYLDIYLHNLYLSKMLEVFWEISWTGISFLFVNSQLCRKTRNVLIFE